MSDATRDPLLFGLAIEVGDDWLDNWRLWGEVHRGRLYIMDRLSRAIFATFKHERHGAWSPEAPVCPLCTWAACLERFWDATAAWVVAEQEANRPRCVDWERDGRRVTTHVDPCTCHDDCPDRY